MYQIFCILLTFLFIYADIPILALITLLAFLSSLFQKPDFMNITETTKIPFGRYKGMMAKELCNIDPDYLIWLHEKTSHIIAHSLLREAYIQHNLSR